jgi:hypothetical protein
MVALRKDAISNVRAFASPDIVEVLQAAVANIGNDHRIKFFSDSRFSRIRGL